VLALALDFNGALICARVSAAIADLRKINVACARNLIFFLERLTDRVRNGQGERYMLEQDEEMLAYASGDLQEDARGSWVWTEAESPSRELSGSYSANMTPIESPEEAPPSGQSDVFGGEWQRVEALLVGLRHEQQRQRPLPPFQHGRSQSMQSVAQSDAAGRHSTPNTAFSPGGNERMNIANII